MASHTLRRAEAAVFLCLVAGVLSVVATGCAPTPTPSPPTAVSQTASSSVQATTPAQNPSLRVPREVNERVLAKGGSEHQGQTLYLALIAEADTKDAADQKREAARSAMAEFQTYYVVDESSHFEGLAPGTWIVFEPYKYKQNADSQSESAATWLESAGLMARVTKVRVRCRDSFPLVEDKLKGLYPSK